jgi:NTE family protein
MVAARLPRAEWPDRPMIVVAVDAHTGEPAAFDHDSGVGLADAVTPSTALPGLTPTHSINGTRYITGGVRFLGLVRAGNFTRWRVQGGT